MDTRRYVLGFILIVTLCMAQGVIAELHESNISFNSSQAAMEVGLPVKPMFHEAMTIPQPLDLMSQKASYINGTGNLTKLVEFNNSAGEYSFAQLIIKGTDATSWSYTIQGSNATNDCYASALVQVQNADQILLQGHSISKDRFIAYAGAGLQDTDWNDAGRYSGTIRISTETGEDGTLAIITGSNETGSIDHLCRSYHEIYRNCSELSTNEVPGLEWSPDTNYVREFPSIFCYDQYAGDFASVSHGGLKKYSGYAISYNNESYSYHNMAGGSGKAITVNTYGEQWPPGNMNMPGNGSYEQVRGTDVTSFDHLGEAIFFNKLHGAYGETEATAGNLDYRISPTTNKHDPMSATGYVWGSTQASTPQSGTNKSAIPATMNGWLLGEFVGNTGLIYEGYQLSGVTVNRNVQGGIFSSNSDFQTGVSGNITAGRSDKSTSVSRIDGASKWTIDLSDDNATTLDGRWMVDSMQGSPVSRSELAIKPGTSAYISSKTYSGSKYIKDRAYYKSGTVDVQ
ncbi:hypothetical protein [uncultured Methanospirillum sp.]|uniref:hypothetical protein n=1 Tax=uncultured Methanospirillum sp. TaxID=262503 RepID=UPI0029C622BA|nr:hypothetical protein [uncultured Methanospirillum sp.]